jgi:4-amino-4-deoxy-L-arabinose transferase-like glycosyltransferase
LHDTFYDAFIRWSGTFRTEPTMTPAFGHLLPVWLAQAATTFGDAGLFRLNGAFSLLSAGVFYGVVRNAVTKPFAVVATLIMALNPGQIWVSRTTLTEILTQLLLWTAIWLLVRGLAEGRAASARWAGIVLGAAVLVRIDVVVVVGPILIAHLGMRVIEGERYRSGRIWRALYEGLVPSIALASAYFVVFSRPYVVELRPQLVQLLAVSAVAALALVLGTRPIVWPVLQRFATSRPSLVALGCLVAALTVYAYFIRPNVQPFETYEPTRLLLGGKRTYDEEALPNLGAYLSMPLVLGGIAGWYVTYWQAARARVGLWMPLLLVGGGFTALYVANPSVTPDHFWAVRRFVPIVFPALIAFAALGAMRVIRPLPARASLALCLLALAAFGLFSVTTFRPFVFLAEHNGYRPQLAALASQLPEDQIVLALDGERWWKPLYTLFGRKVVPLSLNSEAGRDTFRTWVSRELASGRFPTIVARGDEVRIPGLAYTKVGEQWLTRLQHRGIATPPPRERSRTDDLIGVFRVDGPDTGFSYFGANLVDGLIWGAERTGYHNREMLGDRTVTWTDGTGRLVVPVRTPPQALEISLIGIPGREVPFRLVVNGQELRAGILSPSGWAESFDLSAIAASDTLVVELLSDTVVQRREVLIDGSLYRTRVIERSLGVPVNTLALRPLTIEGP